jgi:hypothetical protein
LQKIFFIELSPKYVKIEYVFKYLKAEEKELWKKKQNASMPATPPRTVSPA